MTQPGSFGYVERGRRNDRGVLSDAVKEERSKHGRAAAWNATECETIKIFKSGNVRPATFR